MSVGTNENVKNVNENIQKFENGDIVKNTTVNTVSELEKTQKIVILDELLRDTENSKKEFLEDYSGQKSENENIENNEILNSENSKQFTQQQPSIQEMKSENTQNDISQENLINNSQENVINEIIAPAETLKNIEEQTTQTCAEVCVEECEEEQHEPQNIETPVQAVVENTANMQEQASENIITNQEKQQENSDIVKEENLEEKEKRHTQDKKDYRLERMLFDRINAMQGKIKESLELIKKFERINAKEENLPNIVTTLHDKLTQEVIKQFRTVGIEFNMKSYLVQSIVSDLLNKFEEGITEFKDCSENLNFVREVQDDFESKVELVSTSKVKNLIARLRGLFKPERKQEKLEQLERERQEKKLEEANIHLIKYKFKNNELEKYTIKNNIVHSLTREILTGHGSGLNLTLNQFIEQKITPEMKKLGLENLIPQLEENIIEEYKEKFNNAQKEDILNMQVGELKRNVKSSRVGYIRTKVNLINSTTQEEERMVV